MSQNDDPTNDPTNGATAPTPPAPPPPTPPPTPPQSGTPVPPGQPAGPPPGQAPRPQDRFFDGIRRTGLRRSQRRVVGGVSGGLAQRMGVDVTVVRVLTVVLAIFGGLGLLAYGLAWLLLPEPDGRIHAEQVLRGDVSAGAVGGIITSVLGFGGLGGSWGGPFGWHGNGFFGWFWGLSSTALFVGVIALVIYAVSQSRSRPGGPGTTPYGPASPQAAPYPPSYPPSYPPAYPTGPQQPYGGGGAATMTAPGPGPTAAAAPAATLPRRRSFGGFGALAVAGLATIGAGITALVMSNGSYDASTAVMSWAVALAVISVALVVGGLAGRRAGIVSLLAIIATIGTLVAMVPPKMSHLEGSGDRIWRPVSAASASDGYGVGAGDGTLDLTGLDRSTLSTSDPLRVSASVGFGRLTVLVPSDLVVRVRAAAGAGNLARVDTIRVTDQSSGGVVLNDTSDQGEVNGVGIHRTTVIGTGPAQVEVEANVGFGEIRIEQQVP